MRTKTTARSNPADELEGPTQLARSALGLMKRAKRLANRIDQAFGDIFDSELPPNHRKNMRRVQTYIAMQKQAFCLVVWSWELWLQALGIDLNVLAHPWPVPTQATAVDGAAAPQSTHVAFSKKELRLFKQQVAKSKRSSVFEFAKQDWESDAPEPPLYKGAKGQQLKEREDMG